jgi:HK97 family phage major capsid protein
MSQELTEIKSLIETHTKAVKDFQDTCDARDKAIAEGKAIGDFEARMAKAEADIAKTEAINAKMTVELLEAKKALTEAQEAKEAVESLEVRFNRQGLGGIGHKQKVDVNQWARAVVDAHTKGVVNLTQDQQKALHDVANEYKAMSVSNDTTGGYLAPAEYVREIIKTVTEISPARQLARVRTTGNKSILLPKRTGQFAALWTAENATRTETTGLTYGMLEIFTHELYAMIDISEQNLEDSAFNLGAEIAAEATEQFAVAEGAAFVSGTGVGKPEGFMTNSSVSSVNSGSASAITADGLLSLKHAIKTAYTRNASWALNRTTLSSVRKLKDTTNQYIWQSGLAAGKPNTIDGDPYVEVPDMPSEGANTYPVAYGDFAKAYTLVDRIAMSMLRDPYTQATSGNIRFLFRRRLGGMVTQPEAIAKLKCST